MGGKAQIHRIHPNDSQESGDRREALGKYQLALTSFVPFANSKASIVRRYEQFV